MFAKESKFMKKIRILAVILAVLMLPLALFVACDNGNSGDDEQAYCENGHSFGKKETISKKTCTTAGIEHRKCRRCPYVEVTEIPATGHAYTDLISDNNATCTEDGTSSIRCRLCSYREAQVVPGSALGHRFLTYTRIDDYTEKSICHRCGKGEDIRLTGLYIDFEGDMSHPSYDEMTVFTDTDPVYKEETVGGATNSYLTVARSAATVIGSTEFGVILTPRADVLKGTALDSCPSYVVSFSIRINKNDTKDLILLQGSKDGVKETFLTYDSAAGTINSNEGPVYALTAADYGNWLNIAVRLNDGKKVYEVYVNNKIVTPAYGAGTTAIAYVNDSAYFMGYSLEYLRIAMTAAEGVASTFDVDNIDLYVAEAVKGYNGETNVGYNVYETDAGDKIVYKASADGCTCAYVAGTPVAATCVTSGYTLGTCAVCGGQEVTNVVAPEKHNWVTVSTVNASCTVAAYVNSECDKCGARNITYSGDPLGHEINTDPATGYKVVAPRCTEDGWTEGVCVRCEIAMTIDVVEALGHEPDYVTEGAVTIVAPTCTEEGYTTGKCVRYDDCGYEYEKTDVVAALGHKCAAPTTVAPTCTEAGYNDCICDVCETKYQDAAVPALGHVLVSNITTANGVSTLVTTCSRCNEKIVEQELLTEVPGSAEMAEYFKANGNQIAPSDCYYFDNEATGYIRGSVKAEISTGNFVGRYGTLTTKDDLADNAKEGNKYGEWEYKPSNASGGNTHNYFDVNLKTTTGKNFVFEMSFRMPAGETKIMDFFIQAITRSDPHAKKDLFSGHILDISNSGLIYYNEDTKNAVGQITADAWTRVAIVFKTNPDAISAYDIYVDGNLMAADIPVATTLGYDFVSAFRCQRWNTTDGKLDVDEIYAYYAEVPFYVQSMELPEKPNEPDVPPDEPTFPEVSENVPTSSDMAAYFEHNNNKISNQIYDFDSDKVGTVRGDNNAAATGVNGFTGRYGTLTTKADTMISGNNYGQWYYTPENKKGTDSTHTYFDLNPKTDSGQTWVMEISLRIPEGETKVMPFSVQLIDRSNMYNNGAIWSKFLFVVNENGDISTDDRTNVVGALTSTAWTRIACVIHSNPGKATTYDMYIDGYLVAKDLTMSNLESGLGYEKTQDVRFQRETDKIGGKLDMDEVYLYFADKPWYVKEGFKDYTTKVPTPNDMAAYFEGMGNKINNKIYNFEDDEVGTVRGDNNKIVDAVDGFTGRYATITTKEDATGKYAEWYYTPGNKQGSDSVHSYFDLNPKTAQGVDVVIELSLRKTAGTTEVMPFSYQLIDRSNEHESKMISHNIINVNAAGEIIPQGMTEVVGTVGEGAWTRIAAVIHAKDNEITTFDVYVDGVMVAKDVALSRTGFDLITDIRFQVNDQKSTAERKIDIDEVYLYYASKPYYVLTTELPAEPEVPAEPGRVELNVDDIASKGGTVIAAYDFQQDDYVAGDYISGGKSSLYAVSGAGSNFKDLDKNLIKIVADANGNKYYQYAKKDGAANEDHYFDIMFCKADGNSALTAAKNLGKIGASFVFTMDFMPGTFTGTLVTLTTRYSSGQYGDAFSAVKVAGNVLQDKDGNEIATLTEGEFSTVAVLFVPGTTVDNSKYYVYVNRVCVTPEGVAFLDASWMEKIKDANGDGTITPADYVPNHIRLAQTSTALADDMAFDNIAIYYADTYAYEVVVDEDDEPAKPNVPTASDMEAYFTANGNKLAENGYDFDSTAVGNVIGSTTSEKVTGNFVGRYGAITTKEDSALAGNKYGEWDYQPSNKKEGGNSHCYFDMNTRTESGKNVVFEFSLRKTAGTTEMLDFYFQAADDSRVYNTSGKVWSKNLLDIAKDGTISCQGTVIGQVTGDAWTRVAIAFKSNPGTISTYDVYVDGYLMAKDVPATTGNGLDVVTHFRFSRQSDKDAKADIDEVYCYYADKPYYMVSDELPAAPAESEA